MSGKKKDLKGNWGNSKVDTGAITLEIPNIKELYFKEIESSIVVEGSCAKFYTAVN